MHGNIVTEMTQSMSVLRSPCTVTSCFHHDSCIASCLSTVNIMLALVDLQHALPFP